MAVIQFGAIVTDARGKLGGHTFRKFRSTNVLQKTATVRTADFYEKNRQLQQLQYVSSSFRDLSQQNKNSIYEFAQLNPVPDRFGNPHILTVRNMWQLLASNLYFATGGLPDPNNLCNVLNPYTYSTNVENRYTIFIQNASRLGTILLKAYSVSECINYYPANLFVLQEKVASFQGNQVLDLTGYFSDRVNFNRENSKVVVQVQEVNQCGWAGAPAMFVFNKGVPIDF